MVDTVCGLRHSLLVVESDGNIPEKNRTGFLWGNGWERGRGEMRPVEAVNCPKVPWAGKCR